MRGCFPSAALEGQDVGVKQATPSARARASASAWKRLEGSGQGYGEAAGGVVEGAGGCEVGAGEKGV